MKEIFGMEQHLMLSTASTLLDSTEATVEKMVGTLQNHVTGVQDLKNLKTVIVLYE